MTEQFNWTEVGRIWGPLGIVFVIAVLFVIGGARVVKALILGTIEDARRERDYMREQRNKEAQAFIESLRVRDELMKEGFDEVLHELRGSRRK